MDEILEIQRRQSIESTLFKLAIVHAIEAGKHRDKNSYSPLLKEMEESIISIIMCFTSLEGFANSIGLEFYGKHPNEDRRKKWWEGTDGSHPMIELSLIDKLSHLVKEVAKDNPKINVPRSLNSKLRNKLEHMRDVRVSIIHYRAESYKDDRTTEVDDGTLITPEFDIYNYEQCILFLKTYEQVVNEFNKYARKAYGSYVARNLKEYSLNLKPK